MFKMIGHYEIRRERDVIRVWSSPVFNLEAAQQYALDMMALIEDMPPRFGTLVEFDAPPVVGPEVEAAMRRSAFERGARGMAAVAFVTRSDEGLRVASAQWDRLYAGTGIVFGIFRELEPAQAWLDARLA